MYLGEGAGGLKCIAARGTGGGESRFSNAGGRGMGMETAGAGAGGTSWMFDSKKKVRLSHA